MPANPTKGITGGVGAGPKESIAEIKNRKKWTQVELEELWILAGGNPYKAREAAAISVAENRTGDARAENHNEDGSIDRGLWQINSIHGIQSTFDPLANAEAAVNISNNGRNWSPWTTYKNKEYLKYLKGSPGGVKNTTKTEQCVEIAGQEICGPLGQGLAKGHEAVTGAVSWTKDLGKVLSFLGSGAGWTRVLKVAGGGIIIIIALSELAKAGSGSSSPNIATKTGRVAKDVTIGAAGGELAVAAKRATQARTQAAMRAASKAQGA